MELNEKEIHYLGMNFIGEKLQEMGYEFLGVNSDLKKHPQFVLYKKDEKITFVIVKTVCYPADFSELPSVTERVVEHAKSQDSNVWFAGVGLMHADDPEKKVLKSEDYKILFNGFKILHS